MIFNQMLSRTIKTPNLTKTELSSIFFSLCTVAFLLCKQTNFRFCGKVDREASDCILPWADPCLSPKRDLTLSLTFSLTHSLAHLPATRSSRHTLREDINGKKTFSFGHCPNTPPTLPPIRASYTIFFGRQKQRFSE